MVQDIYDTIESAEGATVFFPVVSGMKKEGTYINLERRLSVMRQVLPREENKYPTTKPSSEWENPWAWENF